MHTLQPGDALYLSHNGTVTRCKTIAPHSYAKQALPQTIWAGGKGHRTLIVVTCGGEFRNGHYDNNVVLTAEPFGQRPQSPVARVNSCVRWICRSPGLRRGRVEEDSDIEFDRAADRCAWTMAIREDVGLGDADRRWLWLHGRAGSADVADSLTYVDVWA